MTNIIKFKYRKNPVKNLHIPVTEEIEGNGIIEQIREYSFLYDTFMRRIENQINGIKKRKDE